MYAIIFRLRCCIPGVVLLIVVLALTPLAAMPAQAQPPAPQVTWTKIHADGCRLAFSWYGDADAGDSPHG